MDDIHVTVLWVVSLTHGKARETQSIVTSRPNELERVF